MIRIANTRRAASLAISTALASALLAGCSGLPTAKIASGGAPVAASRAQGRALTLAERAVQADPRNAASRAALGSAYLDAGRFASAATSFDDAMKLGDNSPRTALSLALAMMGQGKMRESASLLNDWEGEIAAADLGLALALSGQPERGVQLMSNAIRGGENTPKMRQNLAYAYALSGSWREARLMAAQDVPADKLGARMQEWAELAVPEAWHLRVAAMLNVPAGVVDAGQPAALALANSQGVEQLVAEASAQSVPTAELPALPASAELPPLAVTEPAPPVMPLPPLRASVPVAPHAPAPEPAVAVASYAAPKPVHPAAFEKAFADAAAAPVARHPSAALPAVAHARVAGPAVATGARRFAKPAIKPAVTPPASHADATVAVAATGSHLVQLGSFASEQGARRAWGIYVRNHPELAGHQMVISQALVKGRNYWRVAAAGFGRADSSAMCGRVKAKGEGCFAYAEGRPLPGVVDGAIRMARR
ncbi:MAG: hypothetical protein RLZZ08_818 [Pseudomonadota bacterium]|jgi:Flp pilus assembly protein TadD